MIRIVDGKLNESEHATAIVQLLDEYARDLMGGGQSLSEYCKANLIGELSKRPNIHTVLAFDGTQPIGLSICIEGFSTFACKPLLNIHDMMVSTSHRGKGVSKQILQHVESVARRLGCCKLTLEVLENNRVAFQLYRSMGFAQYQLDPSAGGAVFLQKYLDP